MSRVFRLLFKELEIFLTLKIKVQILVLYFYLQFEYGTPKCSKINMYNIYTYDIINYINIYYMWQCNCEISECIYNAKLTFMKTFHSLFKNVTF